MLDKIRRDLNTPRERYPLAREMHHARLEEYYFVFDESRVKGGKDQALINRFDENGIPINRTYIDVEDQDYVYFPISIGQLGLAVFHTWLRSNDRQDRERFLKFAQWFLENGEERDGLGTLWLTHVPLPQYHTASGWASAFSQARAMNVLLRAFQLTGDRVYGDLAVRALPSFYRDAREGGVRSMTPWGPFF